MFVDHRCYYHPNSLLSTHNTQFGFHKITKFSEIKKNEIINETKRLNPKNKNKKSKSEFHRHTYDTLDIVKPIQRIKKTGCEKFLKTM